MGPDPGEGAMVWSHSSAVHFPSSGAEQGKVGAEHSCERCSYQDRLNIVNVHRAVAYNIMSAGDR